MISNLHERLMMAGALVLIQGCGATETTSDRALALDSFCAELVQAGCQFLERCNIPPGDSANCEAELADIWDGCPPGVAAVELGEVDYFPEEARKMVDDYRDQSCDGSRSPDVALVLVGKRQIGEACHSGFSCVSGLYCDNFSLSTPEGTCVQD
jgi:hypothetical protein